MEKASTEKNNKPTEDNSTGSLSQEQIARIEINREIAREKLRKRAQEEEDARISTGSGLNKFGGFAAKKQKTGKELQYMMDLKDVVCEGSIVRVQGTKLIDTGGGFLLEESDLIEQEEVKRTFRIKPAAFIPTDTPICEDCGMEFADSFLLQSFNYNVCDSCKDTEDKHKLITKTDARNEYLLKDVDLDKREPILKYISRPNPHKTTWGEMKLYLKLQIEKRAIEVWGSLEKIEEQMEIRDENRVKSKMKKYNKKMVSLRMSARSSLYTRDLKPHEHTWGPDECIDDDNDMYKHKCTDCGQEETFEKM